jgi:hypothetical protein
MPQRSNDFQRLIHLIEATLAQHGAVVRESEMITSRRGEPREVDIAVHLTNGPHTLTIAVECRDRARPADVEWIDALIGKYNDMPVAQVVAVSRTGFTSGAKKKASENGILCWTLEEAHQQDHWMNQLKTTVVEIRARAFTLERYTVVIAPPESGAVQSPDMENAILHMPDGQSMSVHTAAMSVYHSSAILEQFHDIFAAAEVNETVQRAEISLDLPPDTWVTDAQGFRYRAQKIELLGACRSHGRDLDYQPGTYAGQQIAHVGARVGALHISSVVTGSGAGASRVGIRVERLTPIVPPRKMAADQSEDA